MLSFHPWHLFIDGTYRKRQTRPLRAIAGVEGESERENERERQWKRERVCKREREREREIEREKEEE